MVAKKILGAAVATIVLTWPLASHADDEGDLVEVKPGQPTREPGINPQAGQTAQPRTSTTQTTAAVYDTNVAAERPAERERGPNTAMLITGSAIFAGTWAASSLVAAFSETKGDENLFIPLVGPWLDLGERACSFGECGAREDWNIFTIVGSGAAQAVGLGLAIGSIFVGPREPRVPKTAEVKVLPISVRGGAGLGAFGTF
jgi:hypothetical protein